MNTSIPILTLKLATLGLACAITEAEPIKPTLFPEQRQIWECTPTAKQLDVMEPDQRQAEANGRLWTETMFRCRRFIDGWEAIADKETGLYRMQPHVNVWQPENSAADNYPFMVLTASMTDRALFEGRMMEILETEQRLTNRIGALPDQFNLSTDKFLHAKPNLGRSMFGASEYIKDGLLPITEWMGKSPWSDRMFAMLDEMWQRAPVDTPYGKIVSTDIEINGEMLQTLSRVYWMTGDKKYLEWAIRLGDYYMLGDHHPTRNLHRLRLRDHGCEIVSGLCELYTALSFANPEKKKAYQAPIHEMLDRILEVGRNDRGMLYDEIDPVSGKVLKSRLADTWGYNLDGFYCVYLVDKVPAYREATLKALNNIQHYRNYRWEGDSHDGYADSIESALNLYNREPVASAGAWIDSEIKVMHRMQQANGRIGDWYGDGNFARTSIMYGLWKSQGLTSDPWREDLRIGAVRNGDKLIVSVAADKAWSGKVKFDTKRHKAILKLPIDWPRINQFPEWFTVDADKAYQVTTSSASAAAATHSGKELADGLQMTVEPGQYLFFEVATKP